MSIIYSDANCEETEPNEDQFNKAKRVTTSFLLTLYRMLEVI